jgi:hypothetical protein
MEHMHIEIKGRVQEIYNKQFNYDEPIKVHQKKRHIDKYLKLARRSTKGKNTKTRLAYKFHTIRLASSIK